MENCIFCKIVKKEMDTQFEKETEHLVVFKDIHPQAPVHLLIVPKVHAKDITEVDDETWKEIKDVAVSIARSKSLTGFRLVNNAGDSAEVKHMHVHLLGEVSADRAV
jgi:histidine triad (HIT) family protein